MQSQEALWADSMTSRIGHHHPSHGPSHRPGSTGTVIVSVVVLHAASLTFFTFPAAWVPCTAISGTVPHPAQCAHVAVLN